MPGPDACTCMAVLWLGMPMQRACMCLRGGGWFWPPACPMYESPGANAKLCLLRDRCARCNIHQAPSYLLPQRCALSVR